LQNLQICCCITLKESYDPDNEEAASKDVSPNTSLPTRNICTNSVAVLRSVGLFRRRGGSYSRVTPVDHIAVAKGLNDALESSAAHWLARTMGDDGIT
jgi:hypothetical protein